MPQPQPQRTPFKVENKADRKPFKPKPWSHQDELARLKGKMVNFKVQLGANAHSLIGTVMEVDNFTVKVGFARNVPPQVLSKHAIIMFQEVGPDSNLAELAS